MVTWDSKILTVVSLLGGAKDIVREGMKKDGIYEDFLAQVNVRPILVPRRGFLHC